MDVNASDLMKKLRLTDEEEVGITVKGDCLNAIRTNGSFCLIGSLWTTSSFNREVLNRAMKSVWNPEKDLKISDVGENLFLFQFSHEVDRLKVLDGCSRFFDKHVLLVDILEGEVHPSQIKLEQASFWIRVMGLPPLCLNRCVGEIIGKAIG